MKGLKPRESHTKVQGKWRMDYKILILINYYEEII